MSGFAVRRIGDMEAAYGGSYKRARAELGVSAFGMQVIDMAPNETRYPEHDHSSDGQEEVYIALRGGGEMEVGGERVPIDPETMIRVSPGTARKVWPGEEGVRLRIVGGVPGKLYEPPEISELGVPDPLAAAQRSA
jgi:mannose-6-phosphate isomerase-like protein (cupin superfamily)